MRLNHNALAYAANNNLNAINNNLTRSMERLSSGNKINKSSDDPAAYAISQRMQMQIRGLERATNNANDGISLIQTGEGALNEVHSILQRIRELSVKAANDTFAEEDIDSMQAEIKQLLSEMDRIAETTDFNGRKLLNGELNKKGYTDTEDLSIFEIGGDIDPGEYGITFDASTSAQAQVSITALADDYVIAPEESGTLLINGLEIDLRPGMTGAQINARIRDASNKIGIDYDADNNTLTTREYGRKQSITVSATSTEIEGLFGITGTVTEYGEDAKASFTTDDDTGERIGFADTATIEAEGNRITVTDKDGFRMVYDAKPGSTGDANITVLSAGPMVFQIGNDEGQVMNINIAKTSAESLGIDKINIYTHAYASDAIEKIDQAIIKISDIRSALGAYQNRLEYTVTNLETANENMTSAVSRIKDTDMAEEITEYTEKNVLSQSAIQMLTRSNARPEGLLQLFQR